MSLFGVPSLWRACPTPYWSPILPLQLDHYLLYGARPPALGGILVAQGLNSLTNMPDFANMDAASQQSILQSMTLALYEKAKDWGVNPPEDYGDQTRLALQALPSIHDNMDDKKTNNTMKTIDNMAKTIDNMAATGLIAVDSTGLTIACDMGMGHGLGGGYFGEKSGIFFIKSPKHLEEAIRFGALSPTIVVDEAQFRVYMALSGTAANKQHDLYMQSMIWQFPQVKLQQHLETIPARHIPQMGGKPVLLHCQNGMPNPDAEERLCVTALHSAGHGLALQRQGSGFGE